MNEESFTAGIGQIFRYGHTSHPEYADFYNLTKGSHQSGIGSGGKGIFHYSRISSDDRIPAILIHSNPFKEGSEYNPWIDDINPDNGYALYNGDNKSHLVQPGDSAGNKIMLEVMELYSDPTLRHLAPPLIITKQVEIEGYKKGYRSFQGYGIPIRAYTRVERETNSSRYFTNLVFEIVIMSLSSENERFDWRWIDDRRNKTLAASQTLTHAPLSWKKWVSGKSSIDSPYIRHNASRSRLKKVETQNKLSPEEKSVIDDIYKYFGGKQSSVKKYQFEALAAHVSESILGENYKAGWVTKKSGDGGVDFIGRLDLGMANASTSIVVLGQAKCGDPQKPIAGLHLARVAARLKRGWIGIFVTTSTFTEEAQREVVADNYPIVLVNGQILARTIIKELNIEKKSLNEYLNFITEQYESQQRLWEPERILTWDFPINSSTDL
jgi:hypothetical protein